MHTLDTREKVRIPHLQKFLSEYAEKHALTKLVWRPGGVSGDIKARILQKGSGKQFAVKNEQNIQIVLEHAIDNPEVFNAYSKVLKNGGGTFKTQGSRLAADSCFEYAIEYENPKTLDSKALANLEQLLNQYLEV